jgi:ABC-type branched-subunit amino acid transport system substrate-binding protein
MGITMLAQKHPAWRLTWCLLFLLLLPATLRAQTSKELDTRVANGKQLLDQGKYDLALAELSPVLNTSLNYKEKPQALYLYSVGALKTQKIKEASDRVTALLQQYPAWPNRAEAQYLAANIALEQKDYAKALQALGEIKDPAFEADMLAMKQAYLGRINDKALLAGLVQQFPEDRDVALVFADKLMAGWYTDKDKGTLDGIINRFNLDRKKYAARAVSQKKGQYNVAVLLPFPLEDMADKEQLLKNQWFTDLYAGISLAKDSLAKQNILLNLYAYNAPADTNKVKTILNLPEMASMDLIIGPVYKSANKIISRFANQHQIIAINPLSDDGALVKNNPYLYLFRASITTQARKSAAFAIDNFPLKTAVVVYSNSPDYILFANAYKAEYEKRGGKVKAMKPISPTSSGGGLYSGLDFSTVGHLVVASNNPSVAYNTISTLERLSTKIPVITYASWLEMTQLSLEQLDDQEVYFLHPWFVDISQESAQAFKRQYVSRYQVPPSEYVHAGFDLMYYFGNILARHGSRFNGSLQAEGPISGAFLQGIGYAGEHDNQYVPLLKLDNLQLNVVNPVFK